MAPQVRITNYSLPPSHDHIINRSNFTSRNGRFLTPSYLPDQLISRACQASLAILLLLAFSFSDSPPVNATDEVLTFRDNSPFKEIQAKHPNLSYWACVDDLIEWLASPDKIIKQPLPDPPPIFFGCQFHDCDFGISGPTSLDITLAGNLAESVTLDLTEPASSRARQEIEAKGQIRPLDQQRRFHIDKGSSHIRGLSLGESTQTLAPKKLIDLGLDRTAGSLTPFAQFRLSLDLNHLKNLAANAVATKILPGKELANLDLIVKQKRGTTAIDIFRAVYKTKWCRIPNDKFPDVDKIHLTKSRGLLLPDIDFDQLAIVLTNGRDGSGWGKPFAVESKILFGMPGNMLQNTGDCVQINNSNATEHCEPEASVFTQDHGMTLHSPVEDWTNSLGEEAKVRVKLETPNIIKVPVHFYILWEHGPSRAIPVMPPPTPFGLCTISTLPPGTSAATLSLSTQCLAETWWLKANMLFTKMNAGIQLDIPTIKVSLNPGLYSAGCRDIQPIYDHFAFTQEERKYPQAIRVYFVEKSQDISDAGDLITNVAQTCGSTYLSGYDIDRTYFNEIFVSTALANSTTLAHEFGHALSLDDINEVDFDPDTVKSHAAGLGRDNLMWSGSDNRTTMTIAQSFRANVNIPSALHRLDVKGRVLEGTPRICQDQMENQTCPRLTLMPN